MSVNLSAPRVRCLVGGVDFSREFLSFVGRDDALSESGLVKFVGAIELSSVGGGRDVRPDRDFVTFATGVLVTIDLWDYQSNQWRRHPRGAVRILSAAYQPGTGEQADSCKLEVGCRIAACGFREPTDFRAAGTQPGQSVSALTVLGNLLQSAGFQAWTFAVPEAFSFRWHLQFSGAYIAEAGKLAASLGGFLWADNAERAWLLPIALQPQAPLVTLSVNQLDGELRSRVNGIPPAGRVIATGQFNAVSSRSPVRTESSREEGSLLGIIPGLSGQAILNESTLVETIDWGACRRAQTETNLSLGYFVYNGWEGLPQIGPVPSSQVVTTHQYETSAGRRLLVQTTAKTQPRGQALRGYLQALYDSRAKDNRWAQESPQAQHTTTSTITYFYNARDELIQTVEEAEDLVGATLASLGSLPWQEIYASTGLLIYQPQVTRRKVTQYKKLGPNDWEILTQEFTARALDTNQRGAALGQINAANKPVAGTDQKYNAVALLDAVRGAVALGSAKVSRSASNTGNNNPRAPERLPAKANAERREAVGEAVFPSPAAGAGWRPATTTKQVPYLPDQNGEALVAGGSQQDAWATKYASVWGGLEHCRWQSYDVVAAWHGQWYDYRPWQQVVVTDSESEYALTIDGANWEILPDQQRLYWSAPILARRDLASGVAIRPFQAVLQSVGRVKVKGVSSKTPNTLQPLLQSVGEVRVKGVGSGLTILGGAVLQGRLICLGSDLPAPDGRKTGQVFRVDAPGVYSVRVSLAQGFTLASNPKAIQVVRWNQQPTTSNFNVQGVVDWVADLSEVGGFVVVNLTGGYQWFGVKARNPGNSGYLDGCYFSIASAAGEVVGSASQVVLRGW